MSADWEITLQQLVEEARKGGVACGDLVRMVIEEWMFREEQAA